jgi:hypothetical protein
MIKYSVIIWLATPQSEIADPKLYATRLLSFYPGTKLSTRFPKDRTILLKTVIEKELKEFPPSTKEKFQNEVKPNDIVYTFHVYIKKPSMEEIFETIQDLENHPKVLYIDKNPSTEFG